MKKINTTKKSVILNYATLPQALRLAASADAVARVKAGESITDVAKAFGTTFTLVNSWVKRDVEGTLGKRLHDDKVTDRVDHRNLPDAVREAGRKMALKKVKEGNGIAKTARELGTSQLSVRRWMEGEEQGFNGYAKRGRKSHSVEAEVSTEVTSEVVVDTNGENI